eukprot:766801-Rhodomonas_salina.2
MHSEELLHQYRTAHSTIHPIPVGAYGRGCRSASHDVAYEDRYLHSEEAGVIPPYTTSVPDSA